MERDQLVISEYPFGVEPTNDQMLARHRIIAGIGEALLITESHSQESTTPVIFALNQGKDVFCVPDRADQSSTCNKLIAEGAVLVETVEDILENLSC